jgi:hypothetical protein
MLKKEKKVEEVIEETIVEVEETTIDPNIAEKEHLLDLYQELKDRKIDRISDLENQIAAL